MKPTAVLALGCFLLAPVWAVTESVGFAVTINLLPSNNATCTSEALSNESNATVQVVCGTGQFVSIDPNPAKPFLGTHGGAFRYYFGPNTDVVAPASLLRTPVAFASGGSVTALQVSDSTLSRSPVEILVSF